MQSFRGLTRNLERFMLSKNLISKPRFQENFVLCLESRIKSFRVESSELWLQERINVKTAKTV